MAIAAATAVPIVCHCSALMPNTMAKPARPAQVDSSLARSSAQNTTEFMIISRVIEDLRQPAVAGPSVQVNEVGCDADGPILGKRQCDELGPVLAIGGDGIDSAGATGAPVVINDQVQATRVAPDLGVMLRRPAGAGEVHWCVQFDAKAF